MGPLTYWSTMCGGCGSNTMITADGRHFIAHLGRDGQPCPGDHEYKIESAPERSLIEAQLDAATAVGPSAGDQLVAAIKDLGVVLSELALVMKLHRWLTTADQVVGMTVPVPVVHRLAEPVRGLLVQVDLRRGRPPYVVLRDDHGAEIPVQPETVRKFLPPIPVPPEEAALLDRVSLPAIVEAARRVLKTPTGSQGGAPADPTGGWCAPTDAVVRGLDPGHLAAVRETEEVGG
jgi:hypothetical protein